MIKKDLKNFNVIPIFLLIIILIFNFLLIYFNLNNLMNSDDKVKYLISVLGSMILPYMIISIIIQIVVLGLTFTNKKLLNIFTIIIEIIYFLFTNITVTPFMFLNLAFFNNLLAYLVILIFEILNIYVIVSLIKKGNGLNE